MEEEEIILDGEFESKINKMRNMLILMTIVMIDDPSIS